MRFVHIEMCGECQMHTPFQRLSVEKKKKCKITRVFFFFFNIAKVKVYFENFLKINLTCFFLLFSCGY